jgi:hypothetical protein
MIKNLSVSPSQNMKTESQMFDQTERAKTEKSADAITTTTPPQKRRRHTQHPAITPIRQGGVCAVALSFPSRKKHK